ncbi:nucleoside-diphosphate kinase [bacterium]|nr:nucleoside-diphosphate kinase [bacterium]
MAEKTLIIFKPDSVQRRLCGRILTRIESKGFKIVGMKMLQITKELVSKHYAEHVGKEFFPRLEKFTISSPVIVLAVEGNDVIKEMRKLVGSTDPHEAEPGTIRADMSVISPYNLIHASDSPESAERELEIFFKSEEIFDYQMPDDAWLCR